MSDRTELAKTDIKCDYSAVFEDPVFAGSFFKNKVAQGTGSRYRLLAQIFFTCEIHVDPSPAMAQRYLYRKQNDAS